MKILRISTTVFLLWLFVCNFSRAQIVNNMVTYGEVDFSLPLRTWDGFGFNYVQACQTFDLDKHNQDLGGFSFLDEEKKQEIINHVFGDDGLKISVLKMFLDPFHQSELNGAFDHELSTKHMLYFAKEGHKVIKTSGRDMRIISTLYGPPAYLTKQKVFRGRDLDPALKTELALYFTDWAKYLVNEQKLPLHYLSLHNEGESWQRWEPDGITQEGNNTGHDYNMFWPPEQVAEFLTILPKQLKNAGLENIKVTPGETYGWDRFYRWGYATAIAKNDKALEGLGLITSHGFYLPGSGRWNCDHTSAGIDILKEKKPELHTWTTSMSWGNMGTKLIWDIYSTIYTAKSNAVIPWAGIQVPEGWYDYDPNTGCAIWVKEDGSYEIRKGFYFYKQLTQAGQPGMAVASTYVLNSEVVIIAFAQNETSNPDAFILINEGHVNYKMDIKVKGSMAKEFRAVRSSDATENSMELYENIGVFEIENELLRYNVPPKSVTTFFGVD